VTLFSSDFYRTQYHQIVLHTGQDKLLEPQKQMAKSTIKQGEALARIPLLSYAFVPLRKCVNDVTYSQSCVTLSTTKGFTFVL
jgi:hypothetical protein